MSAKSNQLSKKWKISPNDRDIQAKGLLAQNMNNGGGTYSTNSNG